MKTVVITGSARGFGYEMARIFLEKDYNVVICDVSRESLEEAKNKLNLLNKNGKVLVFEADVTNEKNIIDLIKNVKKEVNTIDIWINNAGVNQPNVPIWELEGKVIDRLIDIDLKGTILCSKLILNEMIKQGSGQIYNVEGHGSNDVKLTGLSLYGTAKRGMTYFTEALAHEINEKKLPIQVGKITPGIMITNFISTSMGDGNKIDLDEKTKKIYNILGDYPETIAKFMVEKIIKNKKNNVKFIWLTTLRSSIRFITSPFNKKDYFK